MDREPDNEKEFDLQLDWEDEPPAPPASPAPSDTGLVALGDTRHVLTDAIETIDAQTEGLEAPPGEDIPGALEEVREYIGAAFDVVRDLTVQLVTFADRLESISGSVSGVGPRLDSLGGGIEAKLSELHDDVDARFDDIEHALGNDLDDFGDEVADLAETVVALGATSSSRAERLEQSVVALTASVERLVSQQEDLQIEFGHLAEELASYRRRVQVHGRPPVVTDDQLDVLVNRLTAALDPSAERPRATTSARRTTVLTPDFRPVDDDDEAEAAPAPAPVEPPPAPEPLIAPAVGTKMAAAETTAPARKPMVIRTPPDETEAPSDEDGAASTDADGKEERRPKQSRRDRRRAQKSLE